MSEKESGRVRVPITDKGFISRIYKELLQIKKYNENPTKVGRKLKQALTMACIQTVNRHIKQAHQKNQVETNDVLPYTLKYIKTPNPTKQWPQVLVIWK